MKSLAEIENDYVTKQNEIRGVQDKIETLNVRIERLKAKKNKLQDKGWWGDNLIRPVMEHVKAKFPDLVWDDRNLVPMGLGAKVSVFGKLNGKTVAYLVFSIGDLSVGKLRYETGETKNHFQSGTLGDVNGFNNISKPLGEIEELFTYVQKQLDKNKETV